MINPIKSVTDYVTANTTTKTLTATTVFLTGCVVGMVWMYKEAAKLEAEMNDQIAKFNEKYANKTNIFDQLR